MPEPEEELIGGLFRVGAAMEEEAEVVFETTFEEPPATVPEPSNYATMARLLLAGVEAWHQGSTTRH